jgi:hypothetical protein
MSVMVFAAWGALVCGLIALVAKIVRWAKLRTQTLPAATSMWGAPTPEDMTARHVARQQTAIPTDTRAPLLRGPILVANANADVDLIYRSSIGEMTARRVTIHEIHGVGHRDGSLTLHHMTAYCHLRRAPRTFRFDRVTQASDPETGELGSGPMAMIAKLCGLTNPIDTVELRTLDMPVNLGASRIVAVAPIEVDDGTTAFTEHFRVRVDTVYGNGAGFEGVANRAKTADRRGWGGRKSFSTIGDQPWRVRKAAGTDGPDCGPGGMASTSPGCSGGVTTDAAGTPGEPGLMVDISRVACPYASCLGSRRRASSRSSMRVWQRSSATVRDSCGIAIPARVNARAAMSMNWSRARQRNDAADLSSSRRPVRNAASGEACRRSESDEAAR